MGPQLRFSAPPVSFSQTLGCCCACRPPVAPCSVRVRRYSPLLSSLLATSPVSTGTSHRSSLGFSTTTLSTDRSSSRTSTTTLSKELLLSLLWSPLFSFVHR